MAISLQGCTYNLNAEFPIRWLLGTWGTLLLIFFVFMSLARSFSANMGIQLLISIPLTLVVGVVLLLQDFPYFDRPYLNWTRLRAAQQRFESRGNNSMAVYLGFVTFFITAIFGLLALILLMLVGTAVTIVPVVVWVVILSACGIAYLVYLAIVIPNMIEKISLYTVSLLLVYELWLLCKEP